ncbi:MAG: AraC family transcriptional regulator [Terrimicrobiaceae bacterium]
MYRVFQGIQISIKTYFEYFPAGPQEAVWTFHLSAIGHSRIFPGHPYPPPRHPEGRAFTWECGRVLSAFQLVAISEGRGLLETRSGQTTLSAGMVFLLPPGSWHRYRPDSGTGWTEDWFELRGPAPDSWLANGILHAGPVQISRGSVFWRRFEELHNECRTHRPGYRAVAAGLAMTLLASVVSQGLTSLRGNKSDLPDLARRARELLMQGNEVNSVAHTLGVSYLMLYRSFKRATGLAPKEYAREIRLARAEELLTGTNLSVKEIAGRMGYYSAAHFSLEFKKFRGKPPSRWREQKDQT